MPPFTVTGLTSIINRVLPEPHAGLLAGLLFGTKATLPDDLRTYLIQSGTIHIIALSGMNIAILARLVATSLNWLLGRRFSSLFTLGVIVWFVWFVGPSATIVRAAIMGGISLLAVIFGRQYWGLFSWGVAIIGMLLLHPSWIGDVSFELSAMATLGILLFGTKDSKPTANSSSSIESPRYRTLVSSIILPVIKDDLRLTLAAQIFTIPLILFHFRSISLIAPIANMFITWCVPLLTGLGWITVLAGWIWFPASYTIGWVDWIFLEYIIRTVRILGSLPFAGVTF